MKALLTFLLLINAGFSKTIIERQLLSDSGWKIIAVYEDGYTLSEAHIAGFDMSATQVTVDLNLSKEAILDVIHDTENYADFLKSAESIDFHTLSNNGQRVIGYQHIQIPFFQDRHFLYEFDLRTAVDGDRHITGWKLLPNSKGYQDYIQTMNLAYGEAVYLNEGFGKYIIEPLAGGKLRLSYRLYMDIGGWIPAALVQKSNETGILNLMKDLVREAERRSKI